LIFIVSCQKYTSNPPGIEFISTDLVYDNGDDDDMTVEIDIWDDVEVSSYEIELISDSGFTYFFDENQVNKAFYKISYDFDLSQTNENFNINVKATDNEGNTSKSDIKIRVTM
jgi:hypothetical protein